MSDGVTTALIGVLGTVIGASGAIIVAVIQSRWRGDHPAAVPPGKVEDPTVVLGELVDIRELRILRALYGEKTGRLLASYKDKYYLPSLNAIVKKGWVRQADGRYHMTPKGGGDLPGIPQATS